MSWPPVWVGRSNASEHPKGEVGVLKQVVPSDTQGANRFFLIIDFEDQQYVGALLFRDCASCQQAYKLLTKYCGQSIHQIGDLDLRHAV
jgi:hypothetical protein